jgi:DNA-binding CsgD family transcriptional regulator
MIMRGAMPTKPNLAAHSPPRPRMTSLVRRSRGLPVGEQGFGNAFPDLLGPRRRKQVAAACGLTPQEQEVLRWLCRGLGNRAIAYTLHICLPTLRTHLRSIYAKLNCCDRVDVILHLVHTNRSPKIVSSTEMIPSSRETIELSQTAAYGG